jgi:hypothetical protein
MRHAPRPGGHWSHPHWNAAAQQCHQIYVKAVESVNLRIQTGPHQSHLVQHIPKRSLKVETRARRLHLISHGSPLPRDRHLPTSGIALSRS